MHLSQLEVFIFITLVPAACCFSFQDTETVTRLTQSAVTEPARSLIFLSFKQTGC